MSQGPCHPHTHRGEDMKFAAITILKINIQMLIKKDLDLDPTAIMNTYTTRIKKKSKAIILIVNIMSSMTIKIINTTIIDKIII